jgi:hypothetical protein
VYVSHFYLYFIFSQCIFIFLIQIHMLNQLLELWTMYTYNVDCVGVDSEWVRPMQLRSKIKVPRSCLFSLAYIILCDKVFAYSSSILNSECWYCHQILLLICYTIYMLYRIKIKLIVSRKKIEHVKKLVYIRDLCIQQQIYDICIKIQIEAGSKKSDILHLN